ncbi:hypothetical protein LB518_09710 [Mesorhizobium sp. BR1-1-16]|uniref:hypothetical protein n=1 Tax=Mesorhizobium sp. BR1-1-16 TaxID=2876653 RepID=UPI001CC98487|nr:hypothetical protein [Mesorhizobium sp. BR1-1-16]MBZ9936570.1 hypothetical protein [Mesorhizobium sp. BR1-1-16]
MPKTDSTRSRLIDVPEPADRRETARYIGRMSSELRAIAQRTDLPFLAYLLSMVEDESRAVIGPDRS